MYGQLRLPGLSRKQETGAVARMQDLLSHLLYASRSQRFQENSMLLPHWLPQAPLNSRGKRSDELRASACPPLHRDACWPDTG